MSRLCLANKKVKWVGQTIRVSNMGDQQSRSISDDNALLVGFLAQSLWIGKSTGIRG